ncbi:uncharacterized protein LOC128734574 [Sabethes cyaneus]|uniref:uncharacterized protein LOC128734574 n=1 Tax=Sabethes cyaneus TaxID=53552 RepID=UPI00237E14FF|nr:uncharacterized protein LOC128734574 [Sabethes cyaneus]
MNPVSLYITTSRLVFQSGCGGIGGGAGGEAGAGADSGSAFSSNSAFADLNRLLPYLRKSLSCAVCCQLLIEPHTPAELNCQHHVCRGCVGERKKLKPSCASCKDYNRYVENNQLRMLLQCYKSICEYIKTKPFFVEIRRQAGGGGSGTMNGISVAVLGPNGQPQQHQQSQQNAISVPSNLYELIEEGAQFQDNYKCSSGLTRSAYSILPCIYPVPPVTVTAPSVPVASTINQQQMLVTSSTGGLQKVLPSSAGLEKQSYVNNACPITLMDKQQLQSQQASANAIHQQQHQQQQHQHQQQHQQQQQQQKEIRFRSAPIKTVSNGSTMYSVLYAGNGNKITIKRKMDPPHVQRRATLHTLDKDGQIKLQKTLAENSASIARFKMPPVAGNAVSIPVVGTMVTGAATSGSGNAAAASSGGSGNQAGVNNAASGGATGKQNAKQLLKRRGCRCGNATATPGKLTCCGQRCPCYVESKSCVDCKCRGCRNPHRADGMKVRPHIPELQNIEINLHNATGGGDALSTATTTVLAPSLTAGGGTSSSASSSSSSNSGNIVTINPPPVSVGLTAGKSLAQYGLPGAAASSTLKITPTSIANVLTGSSGDGMELVPSGGLLDSNGFSYLTPAAASLDASGIMTTGSVSVGGGGAATQYAVPTSSLANGGTIHVVGVYTTHLGDVSCSPTLSNMIRTDSGLSSLLTHKPPDALLTQSSLNSLSLSAPSTLLDHSLFNPVVSTTATMTASAAGGHSSSGGGGPSSSSSSSAAATIDLASMGDQLDLGGANLITIDGSPDDRLHGYDV